MVDIKPTRGPAPFTPPDTNLWSILKRVFGIDLFRRGLVRFTGRLEFHGVEITPQMINVLRQLTEQVAEREAEKTKARPEEPAQPEAKKGKQ